MLSAPEGQQYSPGSQVKCIGSLHPVLAFSALHKPNRRVHGKVLSSSEYVDIVQRFCRDSWALPAKFLDARCNLLLGKQNMVYILMKLYLMTVDHGPWSYGQ